MKPDWTSILLRLVMKADAYLRTSILHLSDGAVRGFRCSPMA